MNKTRTKIDTAMIITRMTLVIFALVPFAEITLIRFYGSRKLRSQPMALRQALLRPYELTKSDTDYNQIYFSITTVYSGNKKATVKVA